VFVGYFRLEMFGAGKSLQMITIFREFRSFPWRESAGRASVFSMDGIYLEIPEDTLAAIGVPRSRLREELLRRLVSAMYADEVVGGSAPCMLAQLEKSQFQNWRCECERIPPLGALDYELERRNLEEWLSGGD
jgi:hypothetical protein